MRAKRSEAAVAPRRGAGGDGDCNQYERLKDADTAQCRRCWRQSAGAARGMVLRRFAPRKRRSRKKAARRRGRRIKEERREREERGNSSDGSSGSVSIAALLECQ
jgi:hypothetical protein